MEKEYNSNSIKSIIFKILIRLSNFKKNTKTVKNAINYIKKCQNKKYNIHSFKKMSKKCYKGYNFFTYNENKNNIKLVYIHGGSFVDKPMKIQVDFSKKIAERINAELIIPVYETLPNGNCEKFLTEMTELCKYLNKNKSKIFLIGDSAGGGAALSLNMFLLKKEIDVINGIILLSPWLDLSLENENIKKILKKDIVCSIDGNRYLGKKWANNIKMDDYKVSPLYGNVDKIKNIFISCGGNEICQPDCLKFVKRLKDKNINYKFVEFKKQFHNFELFPTKEAKILENEIIDFIVED